MRFFQEFIYALVIASCLGLIMWCAGQAMANNQSVQEKSVLQ